MDERLEEKFKILAEELRSVMVNPDVDATVCFKEAEQEEACTPSKYPYIKITYVTEEHDKHEKIIEIPPEWWDKDIKEIKEFVTFQIEQFMEEIDSVEYGGE